MSEHFGLCPHCGRYQVGREPDGDLACVACGWRKSALVLAELSQSPVADPRISYPVRLRHFLA